MNKFKEKAQEVVSKIEKTTLGEICEYIEEIHTKMHSFLGKWLFNSELN